MIKELLNINEENLKQSAEESCRDIKATKLRQILKVPKEQRIAQHIYNCCREYEKVLDIEFTDGKKIYEPQGIDIFNIEDEEFIKLMENK